MSVSRPPDAPFRTFRDPAGRLEVTGDSVLRHIYPQAAEEARELLASAFYRRCVEKGEVAASQVRASFSLPIAGSGCHPSGWLQAS
jgi:hypothetical protein